ncbi:MAG: radical SAM family heme chaperone HemW [Gammaproteobacteria bacterium]|nr:radical SAM family heme chaperone HemW [Gammaproteobacteria bacterium]MBU1645152.1 radical SAM family heme chaperone HemW [Gammaproteobacteria bacterium]MBU1973389.1 radical SAM family heme chaperone HemW [Gammaproteobacteria bacterium]
MEAPPLALYVHFPWCVKKCPYCDFNSHQSRGGIPEADYLAALIADLDAALPLLGGRTFASAFFGGGTPSLMAAESVATLLSACRQRRLFADDDVCEVTLEANPGTVEAAKFAGFRAAGVNRLSLGIQSFDDAKLKALGRIHSAAEAHTAFELAAAHFDNVNLDVMYALPEQTLDEAQRDIETAIALGPTHISAYHLTLEPNTPFHHAPPPLPDDDLAADMQDMVEETLATAGYEHYETSAFARPGRQCRHNRNYWEFGDYLGIGAGAHSKLSQANGIVRDARPRGPKEYLGDPASRSWQAVSNDELPFEFLMNALRLADGVSQALFERRTGLPLSIIEKSALAARRDGLLEMADDRIRATVRGRRYLNALLRDFLPA